MSNTPTPSQGVRRSANEAVMKTTRTEAVRQGLPERNDDIMTSGRICKMDNWSPEFKLWP